MFYTFIMIANGDGSYGYNVWTIRTLTIDDDGVEVTCSVIPQRGKAVNETRILDVMCKYKNLYFILPLNVYMDNTWLVLDVTSGSCAFCLGRHNKVLCYTCWHSLRE